MYFYALFNFLFKSLFITDIQFVYSLFFIFMLSLCAATDPLFVDAASSFLRVYLCLCRPSG